MHNFSMFNMQQKSENGQKLELHIFCTNPLPDMHSNRVRIVAGGVLVLKHQAITIHNTGLIPTERIQYHKNDLGYFWWEAT